MFKRLFKRLFGSSGNQNVKQGAFFSRWFKKLKSIFKKQPKEITPTPRPEKLSITNKIKKFMKCHHADEENRKKYLKEVNKKAKTLKKKFNMTASEASILDKFITEANKGNGTHLRLINNLLKPKKLTKDRYQKLIKQYEEGKQKKRGISCMMTRSNLSIMASKRKIQNLMEDRKAVSRNLTAILKKYRDF